MHATKNLSRKHAIILVLFFIGSIHYARPGLSQEKIPVKISITKQLPCAIAIIAAKKNFFAEEGLAAEIHYDSGGIQVLESMAYGDIDVAMGISEVPFVMQSFRKKNLVILAAIGGDDISRVILVRKSAKIPSPEFLAGKRIATQENSAMHFFLHVFLNRLNLSERDVALTYMSPEEMLTALYDGQIDACSIREPYLSKAKDMLQGDFLVFELPRIYFGYNLVAAKRAYLKAHPETVRKIFRALKKAEDFSIRNTEETAKIMVETFEMTPESVLQESNNRRSELFLDHGLITTMEDVARWAIRGGLVAAQKIPNYILSIDYSYLQEIKPSVERF